MKANGSWKWLLGLGLATAMSMNAMAQDDSGRHHRGHGGHDRDKGKHRSETREARNGFTESAGETLLEGRTVKETERLERENRKTVRSDWEWGLIPVASAVGIFLLKEIWWPCFFTITTCYKLLITPSKI
jgi:hypothetical protein